MKHPPKKQPQTVERWNLPELHPDRAPTLQSIQRSAALRRHSLRRTTARATGLGGGIVAVITVAVWISSPQTTPRPTNPEQLRLQTMLPQTTVPQTAFQQTESPNERVAPSGSSAALSVASTAPPSQPTHHNLKLYAKIRAETPVFTWDEERGAMVPVGWVRSTDRVPVELETFSQEQIQSLESVLHTQHQRVVL